MRIICNEQISKTRFFEELVSADPQRIFLYQGNEAEFKTNSYGTQIDIVETEDLTAPRGTMDRYSSVKETEYEVKGTKLETGFWFSSYMYASI